MHFVIDGNFLERERERERGESVIKTTQEDGVKRDIEYHKSKNKLY